MNFEIIVILYGNQCSHHLFTVITNTVHYTLNTTQKNTEAFELHEMKSFLRNYYLFKQESNSTASYRTQVSLLC
jgi:hypothetical protein